MRFGQHLRRAVNTLLDIRRQKAIIERDLLDQGLSTEEISAGILETVIEPARRVKLAISSRQINTDLIRHQSDVFGEALQALLSVLTSYPEGYRFQKDNIYYDSKSRPANHMKAFYQLACLFQRLELPAFNCFSLRLRWSPCYMFIDSKMLCQNIPKRSWNDDDELVHLDYWYEVVDLNSKAFRPQKEGDLMFRGMISTDVVGVTVFKKLRVSPMVPAIPLKANKELIPYIISLSRAGHEEISGRGVAVDPGRRDLMYCVYEESTNIAPRLFRYTNSQQDKARKSKKFRRLKQLHKVQRLSEKRSRTLVLDDFRRFLHVKVRGVRRSPGVFIVIP
ncbi:hypothetical protein BX666DRAFT_2157805 [Dichotomocladium elegans]|nr:hypothetical protein BX666DRAFT_2157805 [Dichotomocladium elegans]